MYSKDVKDTSQVDRNTSHGDMVVIAIGGCNTVTTDDLARQLIKKFPGKEIKFIDFDVTVPMNLSHYKQGFITRAKQEIHTALKDAAKESKKIVVFYNASPVYENDFFSTNSDAAKYSLKKYWHEVDAGESFGKYFFNFLGEELKLSEDNKKIFISFFQEHKTRPINEIDLQKNLLSTITLDESDKTFISERFKACQTLWQQKTIEEIVSGELRVFRISPSTAAAYGYQSANQEAIEKTISEILPKPVEASSSKDTLTPGSELGKSTQVVARAGLFRDEKPEQTDDTIDQRHTQLN